MKTLTDRHMQWFAWGTSVLSVLLAFIAWGQARLRWDFSGVGTYQLFPLLGLVAFSLMWSHYLAAAVRMCSGLESKVLHRYFEATSAVVLAAILLHPSLLAWQLWRDGLGLPPVGYKLYVGMSAYWAVVLGLIAWIAFMAYELRRYYGTRPWWRFVQYASDIAMFLIFVHALKLGVELRLGWFRTVWWVYGLMLLAAIVYMYTYKPSQAQSVVKER